MADYWKEYHDACIDPGLDVSPFDDPLMMAADQECSAFFFWRSINCPALGIPQALPVWFDMIRKRVERNRNRVVVDRGARVYQEGLGI